MWNLEKEELWFLIKSYDNYIQNFINNRDLELELPICLEEFYKTEYQNFYQYYLDLLWNDLADIGVDDKDNITENFYIWKKGTFREDIWHWFDERVEGGIGEKYFN